MGLQMGILSFSICKFLHEETTSSRDPLGNIANLPVRKNTVSGWIFWTWQSSSLSSDSLWLLGNQSVNWMLRMSPALLILQAAVPFWNFIGEDLFRDGHYVQYGWQIRDHIEYNKEASKKYKSKNYV